jgi:two-component system copper resistance phosphate regulon response regulator CusR
VTLLSPTSPAVVRVLVVEDEVKTRESVAAGLRLQGWQVDTAGTGDEAVALAAREGFDLVVLDWMLPGRSGLEVLKALRLREPAPQVLMVTARDSVDDRVTGLESGSDDYLTKPFAFAELLARCRVLLRRNQAAPVPRLSCGDLILDSRGREARRAGQAIHLTPREVDILEYLLRHQGQVVTRDMLQRDVWKEPRRLTPLDNVIDVQMARLRRKVDQDGTDKLIHTVRGLGYRLEKETA